MTQDSSTYFDRQKIYEKLDYQPQPIDYNKRIPWVVQQQIAATNGMLYKDLIGRLNEYPIPDLPISKVFSGIMLEIGCGWGRWLVAAAPKGYIPIGMDIRLEFCRTTRIVLTDLGYSGYTVVGDLKSPPFKSEIFDLVWSFSTLQHVCKERLLSCLFHINRILNTKGFCLLEFPNKGGIGNSLKGIKRYEKEGLCYDSWIVRYYTIDEYKEIFESIFGNFSYRNHSFLGLGILPSDLKYVSIKNKPLVAVSLFSSFLTNPFSVLNRFSDSIYIKSFKKDKMEEKKSNVDKFLQAHRENPADNLNILHLICCPVSRQDLVLNEEKTELISIDVGLAFPIIDGIPILIQSEARRMK